MDILYYILPAVLLTFLITWLLVRAVLNSRHNNILFARHDEMNILKNHNVVLQEKLDARSKSIEEVKKAMIDTFKPAAPGTLPEIEKNRKTCQGT